MGYVRKKLKSEENNWFAIPEIAYYNEIQLFISDFQSISQK